MSGAVLVIGSDRTVVRLRLNRKRDSGAGKVRVKGECKVFALEMSRTGPKLVGCGDGPRRFAASVGGRK